MKTIDAYIGLGSNLDEPCHQIRSAIDDLNKKQHTQVISSSPMYRNPPMGPQNQPDYINAAVKIQTWLSPFRLLDFTQSIEQTHGRIKGEHWGPRTIDLDILLFGDCSMYTNKLIIPHPGIKNRDFVLKPLLDLNPELSLPCGTPLDELFKQLSAVNLTKIDDENLTT